MINPVRKDMQPIR